jgi:flagellin
MPLSINTNIASMAAQRSFLESNSRLETAFERLSSGNRVNSAFDDAAGLSIANKMESRVSGMNQAVRNVNDGISMVQIAEGALDEVTSILQRMRDLAVQASNSSLSNTELTYLDDESTTLAAALDDVLGAAKFNGSALINLDGTANGKTIQIGAGTSSTLDQMTFTIDGLSASALTVAGGNIDLTATSGGAKEVVRFAIDLTTGAAATDTYSLTIGDAMFTTTAANSYTTYAAVATALNAMTVGDGGTIADLGWIAAATTGGVTLTATATGAQVDTLLALGASAAGAAAGSADVTTQGSAAANSGGAAAISLIDTALSAVAEDRAKLGATQSQLESTVRNLANVAENTSAAVGRIMDTDYAAETANLTKAQILQQAATSVLAQANAQPQAILALLQ